jgi:hypothetical protein
MDPTKPKILLQPSDNCYADPRSGLLIEDPDHYTTDLLDNTGADIHTFPNGVQLAQALSIAHELGHATYIGIGDDHTLVLSDNQRQWYDEFYTPLPGTIMAGGWTPNDHQQEYYINFGGPRFGFSIEEASTYTTDLNILWSVGSDAWMDKPSNLP